MNNRFIFIAFLALALFALPIVNAAAPNVRNVWLNESDNFYSSASGNNVIHLWVNVSGITGMGNVQVDFTNFSNCGSSGLMNATNGTYQSVDNASIYNATCNVTANATNVPNSFTGGLITIASIAGTGPSDFTINSTIVALYNMTTPPTPGPCMQWGSSTTNFATVSNFSAVNFVLQHKANVSCILALQGGQLPSGAPAWASNNETVALINFTSVDLSTPEKGQLLQGLPQAMQVSLTPPHQHGDSRIYFNTTYFQSLNTTTNITLYHLPFTSRPAIKADAGAMGYNGATVNWAQGTGEGNLTLVVYGFTGYNFSDNVSSLISIVTPTAYQNTTDNTPQINVTLNGTGSQISEADFYINGALIASYTSLTNTANCSNVTDGSEKFGCLFNASTLTDGVKNLTVVAYDYGGVSPGNVNTSSVIFTIDNTPPVVSIALPANATYATNVSLNLSFTTTDATSTVSWMGYSLDGAANVTVTGNTTFNVSTSVEGSHAIVIYANDTFGNMGATARYFSIDKTAPQWTVASVLNVASGVITCCSASVNVSAYDNRGPTTVAANCTYSVSASAMSLTNNTPATLAISGLSSQHTYTCTLNFSDAASNYNVTDVTFTTGISAASILQEITPVSGGPSPVTTVVTSTSVEATISTASAAVVTPVNVPSAIADLTGITQVAITPTAELTNVKLKVEAVEAAALPSGVVAPSAAVGEVLNYMSITPTGFTGDQLTTAKVSFKVKNSDIQEGKDAALARYTGDWSVLPTTKVSSDDTYSYYEATTPGFSVFAILLVPIAPSPTPAAPSPTPTPAAPSPTPTPAATPIAPTPTPTPTPAAAAAAAGGIDLTLIGGIIVVIIIIAAAYMAMKPKKKK
jgi:PGF-pre-PGF domain-containing protein